MSRFVTALGVLLLTTLLVVPVALAHEGEHAQDESPWVSVERLREEAGELIERFRGLFGGSAGITVWQGRFHSGVDREGAGRFDGFSVGTFDRIAIAFGPVASVTDSSITVDGKTFGIDDQTRIPSELEAGDVVLVRGAWVDGGLVARHVSGLGFREQVRESFPRRSFPSVSLPWESLPRGSFPRESFSGSFRVYGEVERITGSSITVGGEEITLTESTQIPDDLQVGDAVTVIGSLREGEDGERVARSVHRGRFVDRPGAAFGDFVDDERFRLSGEVESVILGAGYVKLDLGDRVVRIAPHEVDRYTQNGQPAQGEFVIVSGVDAENGDLLATSVRVAGE